MIVSHGNGIEVSLGPERILVDPERKALNGGKAVISHFHADHSNAVNKKNEFVCSKQTRELIRKSVPEARLKGIDLKKKIGLAGFELSLYSSGHVLGSTQLSLVNGKKLVVTTDFKLQDSLLFKGAEVLPSDILVIEATFGSPEFVFPEREEVYSLMASWCRKELRQGRRVLLSGYRLGKAQELTKFCNEFLDEKPAVHESIYVNNKVYESNNVRLGGYDLLANGNLNEHDVIIIPPFNLGSGLMQAIQLSSNKKISSAIATGWQNNFGFDKSFPLSDHADFNQLLQYVKESSPKLVLTYHGFDLELARNIRKKLGINARPLAEANQKVLAEF